MKIKALLAAAGLAVALQSGAALAAGKDIPPLPKQDWSFDGIFGTFDDAQLQRGYQVYREVCAACHSMNLIAYRNLQDIGFSEEEVKALASEITLIDGVDDFGEPIERPGIAADRLPAPFPNPQAAAAANGGAVPPDLSLVAKARFGGADYLYALLSEGYVDPPEDFDGIGWNVYFGGAIGMANPLADELVEYADGSPMTVSQYSKDVTAFMRWAASPELEARKKMGVSAILFLLVLTGMLYALKRKIWADVKH